jgi:hypothetical protein
MLCLVFLLASDATKKNKKRKRKKKKNRASSSDVWSNLFYNFNQKKKIQLEIQFFFLLERGETKFEPCEKLHIYTVSFF